MVVGNRAGGGTSDELDGNAPRMKGYYDEVVPGDHRDKSEHKALALVAKGCPIWEAKKIPRARGALDTEWESCGTCGVGSLGR